MRAEEIERKFLVRELPADLDRHPASSINQGYLAIGPDGSEVRLRWRGEQASLTSKRGHGVARDEAEIEIYGGELTGLVVAEIEFPSRSEADAFVAPSWLGPEVSEDDGYKNQRLATDGRPSGSVRPSAH